MRLGASNPNAGSWTWFTAGVVGKQDENTEQESPGSSPRDKFLHREREVLRNEVASRTMRTHIVEFTTDSDNDEERRWISELENGDRIAIRAWAQYSGWQNRVQTVSVAIYTAAVI